MNRYIYEGITQNGDKVSGKLFGVREDLISEIRDKGVILTSIKEETRTLGGGKYSLDDFKTNIEELYHLFMAGIKLDTSLAILIKNTRKKAVHEFWEEVLNLIKGGHQFSAALKSVFEKNSVQGIDLYINIISVGEEIGDIKNSFKNVLEHLEFRATLLKEVRSAISYPFFLVLMSMVTVFFVCGFILPKFAKIFSPQELKKLPPISKFTITTGKFLNSHMPIITMVLITTIALSIYIFTLPGVVTRIKQWAYSFPVINKFLMLSDLSNLFSSLASMLEGGVDISRTLRLSTRVVGSKRLATLLEETNTEIKKGNRISRVWGGYDIFPEDVVSLVVVGENSARMGEVFASLGRRYLDKFKVSVARVLTLLEPAIIVILGFFIAFIVVSIMLSVISLGDVTL